MFFYIELPLYPEGTIAIRPANIDQMLTDPDDDARTIIRLNGSANAPVRVRVRLADLQARLRQAQPRLNFR